MIKADGQDGMIKDYLVELTARLRLPPTRRRRVVAEVEDHLRSAAAELHSSGVDLDIAEREAIRRFGPARALAQGLLDEEAAASGHIAGRATVVLAGLLVLAQADPPGLVTWSQVGFPAGLVAFVLGQVALVAGALTLIRIWRARSTRGPRGARLILVLRGSQVVIACAVATLACAVPMIFSSAVAPPVQTLVSLVGLGLGTAAAIRATARGRRRAKLADVYLSAPPTPEQDALSDLTAVGSLALARIERRFAGIRRARERLAVRARLRFPRVTACFGLRRHPWRFASTVALGSGLALAGAHGVSEGGPASISGLARALEAGLLIASIEAGAVLLGFLLLGRFLGIRSRS